MINDEVHSRLINYKFGQALARIQLQQAGGQEPRPNEGEMELVSALARMLDNPGWFDGDLSTIVDAAIASITPEHLKGED